MNENQPVIGKFGKLTTESTGNSFYDDLNARIKNFPGHSTSSKLLSSEQPLTRLAPEKGTMIIKTNEEKGEIKKEDKNTDFTKSVESDYKDYHALCKECIIKDVVGCNNCGIFIYAELRNQYDIGVRRIK